MRNAVSLRPWQDVRASRETEQAQQFSVHGDCRWIGNFQPVAAKRYLLATDAENGPVGMET